jgi:Putative heavy-metal-binding
MSVWSAGPDAAEVACLREAGFQPVGRVTGCAVLNFAWWNHDISSPGTQLRSRYPREYNLDLGRRSEAYARLLYQGRRAAAERMAAQCAALGGDGVVGIRVDVAPYPR